MSQEQGPFSINHVLGTIFQTLTQMQGADIANFYNQICEDQIKYIGDSLFETKTCPDNQVDDSFIETEDYETTDAHVQRLIALVITPETPENALDELVHDHAQEQDLDDLNTEEDESHQEKAIGETERSASDINNGGFESQIRFLLTCYNMEADLVQAMRNAIQNAKE